MAKTTASTQKHLLIDEVRDSSLILKDGSMKAVILVSSINFALKGEDEKNSIILSFQQFMNSLTFPLQILIRSKKLNLDDYLTKLDNVKNKQTNALLRDQTADYIAFITKMLEVVNIMEKSFFVVVPYYPSVLKQANFVEGITNKVSAQPKHTKMSAHEFENNKIKLMQRVDSAVSGLSGIGLRAVMLNTQELIELFYTIYNPSTEHYQRLVDVNQMAAPVIEGPQGEN